MAAALHREEVRALKHGGRPQVVGAVGAGAQAGVQGRNLIAGLIIRPRRERERDVAEGSDDESLSRIGSGTEGDAQDEVAGGAHEDGETADAEPRVRRRFPCMQGVVWR